MITFSQLISFLVVVGFLMFFLDFVLSLVKKDWSPLEFEKDEYRRKGEW